MVGRRPDGACVYLDESQLCRLHAEFGLRNKPLDCQTYPYLLTDTPDGYYVALSYSCPAVVAGVGGSLEQDRPELERILSEHRQEALQDEPIEEVLEVLSGCTIDWGSYLKLEPLMLAAFRPDRPVESLLGMATQLAAFFHPANPIEELSLARLDLAAPFELGGYEKELLGMFATVVISIFEREHSPEERQGVSDALTKGEPVRSHLFEMDLPQFDIEGASDLMTSGVLGRYFANQLFGKKLLAGTLVSRLLALACGCAILLYYLKALRLERAEPHFSFELLDRCFDLVESNVVTHTHSLDGFYLEFERLLFEAVGREFEFFASADSAG